MKLEEFIPGIRYNGIDTEKDIVTSGTLTASNITTTTTDVTLTGTTTTASLAVGTSATFPLTSAAGTAETYVLTAAKSGQLCVQTRASTTTTYTLPAAVAGLWFSFVCGHASGELLITPVAGDAIVGKVSADADALGLAPAAGTGIKNTAATNVVGDHCTLVALDTTTWYMTSVAGVWASQ